MERPRMARMFDAIVEADAEVTHAEDRATSRLIASMLLGPCVIALFALVLWAVTGPGVVVANVEAALVGVAVPLFGVAYLLARRGRNRASAWIIVVASSAAVFALQLAALLGYNPLYRPRDAVVLVFLAIPIVFAGTVLSRRETAGIAAAEIAAILLVPFVVPLVTYDLLVAGPVLLVGVISLMVLAFSAYRERVERARRAELVAEIEERKAAQAALARNRDELETLVFARTDDLERAMEELRDANEAKSRFLANMSHELRTPLNSVIGFTGVMRQGLAGPLTEEQTRQLAMVDNSSRHLLVLINQLLDLARIEAGADTVEAEEFVVDNLLDEVCEALRPLADAKGLFMRVDRDGGAEPCLVTTDRNKLRQILFNLVGNAIKFTEDGEITLGAVARGDYVICTVIDTGIGIPGEAISDIFGEYSQLPGPDGSKPVGTGLGLTVSRRLAALLGGDIGVESEPGSGSRFTLSVARNCR